MNEAEQILALQETMSREHAAWLDICKEVLAQGRSINDCESLASSIRKWGEELHQLRLANPKYDDKALSEARDAYAGQFERGTYPEVLPR